MWSFFGLTRLLHWPAAGQFSYFAHPISWPKRNVKCLPEIVVDADERCCAFMVEDSDFGMSFPVFPGVVHEARSMAEEALAFHIDGTAEDGEAVREPSSLDQVMSDPDNTSGLVILVGVTTSAPKVVRVNVTSRSAFFRFDEFAASHGYTRSNFLARAAERLMRDNHAVPSSGKQKRANITLAGSAKPSIALPAPIWRIALASPWRAPCFSTRTSFSWTSHFPLWMR
jgi:predicted RNase H-like HicB family nuclease